MPRSILSLFLFASLFLLAGRAAATPYSGLVVEPETERVLFEQRADELRHPASLTKMMTLYLVFEALASGELFQDTVFRASRFAVLRPPSRLGLAAGDTITVEEGILALVTRSANDAATVIAEGMAGSESAFASLMTEKARRLGMASTVFRNASGLPDPNQVTTAWDMYRLGRALQTDFPQFYPYFSTDKFYFGGQSFNNHNHLLETYPGTDGIKTGFVNSSGFNLVASAKRNGRRLLGVVFGGPSAVSRDRHMREILDDGFAQLEGAPPRVVTAEFDRPDPPSLLVRPHLGQPLEMERPEPPQPRHLAHLHAPHSKGKTSGRSVAQGDGAHGKDKVRQAAASHHLAPAAKAAATRPTKAAAAPPRQKGQKIVMADNRPVKKAESGSAKGGSKGHSDAATKGRHSVANASNGRRGAK